MSTDGKPPRLPLAQTMAALPESPGLRDGSPSPLSVSYTSDEISDRAQDFNEAEFEGFLHTNLVRSDEVVHGRDQPHTAMVFDCGTGESKAMLFRFLPNGTHGPTVTAEQVSVKVPPVTDFLKESVRPKGGFAFLPEAARPTDAQAVLRPHHFVQFCVHQKQIQQADRVIVGVTAWYRGDFNKLDAHENESHLKAKVLVEELTKQGFLCKILHEKQECYFEAAAVSYAFCRARGEPGNPLTDELPGGYLSGGSGSTQFAHGMCRFVNLAYGNKKCTEDMYASFQQHGNFDEAFRIVDCFANGTADCELSKHVQDQFEQTASHLATDSEREAFAQKCRGDIICISACYFAGQAVKLNSKDPEMHFHSPRDVIEAMNNKIDELKTQLRQWNANPSKHPLPKNRKGGPGSPKDLLLPIANLSLHRTLYGQLLDLDHTRLCFKRDWLIHGDKFRTTWTAGWYLDFLESNFGVCFEGSKDILSLYHDWQETADDVNKYDQALSNPPPRAAVTHIASALGGGVKASASSLSAGADESSVPRKNNYKALLFDCGTGETKGLLLEYDETRGVILSDTKGMKVSFVDFAAGDRPFPDEPFLKVQPNDEFVQPRHLVQFCVEQRDANKADVVVLGCSGWLRHLPAREGFESEEAKSRLRQAVDGLVSELENKDFTIERLTEQHEGFFEAAAVAYGYARRKMPRDLDDTLSDEEIRASYLPTAYLSSGGSSCRVALAMRYLINLPLGLTEAKKAIQDGYKNENDEELGLAMRTFKKHVVEELDTQIREKKAALREHKEDFREFEASRSNPGEVVCIAGAFYGAGEVGMANSAADVTSYPLQEVVEKMDEKVQFIRSQLQGVLAGHAITLINGRKKRPYKVSELLGIIANLTLQQALYTTLFTNNATRLCFKRDWKIREVKFRTTWTAGWFLFHLHEGSPDRSYAAVRYPGARALLDEFKSLLREARLEIAKQEKAFGTISSAAKKKLPMKLISLKYIADTIFDDALSISPKTDEFLRLFKQKFDFEMKGEQHKLKKPESIRRKLIASAVRLLHKNQSSPNYSLDLAECRQSIHDALRYTLVFSNESYTAAVKELEKRLLEEPQWRVATIKFKNYWGKPTDHDQTTYMGINAQITLKGFSDIPRSADFVIEIQLHTPRSYYLKEDLTHKIFEQFRDPLVDQGDVLGQHLSGEEYKLALYKILKQAMHVRDPATGQPYEEGQLGWWPGDPTEPFENYMPTESIAGYSGLKVYRKAGRVQWKSLKQNKKKYEDMIKEEQLQDSSSGGNTIS